MFTVYNKNAHQFKDKKFFKISDIMDEYLSYRENKHSPKYNFANRVKYLDFLLKFYKINKNLQCECCKCKASHFRLEHTSDEKYAFHLYGFQKNKISNEINYVLFTKDHILPKSNGGGRGLYNMRLLCEKCNAERGNSLKQVDKKEINKSKTIRVIEELVSALGHAKHAVPEIWCKTKLSWLMCQLKNNTQFKNVISQIK